MSDGCWFARALGPSIGPCDGRLVQAHLLPKEKLRREVLPRFDAQTRSSIPTRAALSKILWDPRIIVMACGGPMGNGGHHGRFDSWALSVPREKLPVSVLEFARENGLEWMIDWRFGRG